MSNIINSSFDMRLMDDLARKTTVIHGIHPLIKLITTLLYLVVVVSFDKYDVTGCLPLIIYPVIILTLAEIPAQLILKRLLLAAPFVLGIGIFNPFFDPQVFVIGGLTLSKGWISFFSIALKCLLTVSAALLLIATTGMDKLSSALRMLRVPKLFVLQLLLTYRYITVLMEEVSRVLRAYSLRSPQQKGIHHNVWGSLIGQLILRTFDRALRVYQGMCLRGFNGEYNTGTHKKISGSDLAYLAGWSLFFALIKIFNISLLIGNLLTGVVS
jgi:cobalt/nickel transport system permease protein